MSLLESIKFQILLARKTKDKDKSAFLNWFISTALQALSSASSSMVKIEDLTDEQITKHANQVYSTHKKTLDSLANSPRYKDKIEALNRELEYIKPYSTMGLTQEQIDFIKDYKSKEEGKPNLGLFNKALSVFKTIDRREARELYESL